MDFSIFLYLILILALGIHTNLILEKNMKKKNTKIIEEEIRQYKLYKIQIIESKIREYEDIFNTIKENVALKFTKNASSNIFRFLLIPITVILFLAGIYLLFPELVISLMERYGIEFSGVEKREYILKLPFIGYISLLMSIFLGITASLLKKNIRKRNTIYNLSKLLKDVIDYMNEDVNENKKKYEYFVDSMAEIENKKNAENKNTSQE